MGHPQTTKYDWEGCIIKQQSAAEDRFVRTAALDEVRGMQPDPVDQPPADHPVVGLASRVPL